MDIACFYSLPYVRNLRIIPTSDYEASSVYVCVYKGLVEAQVTKKKKKKILDNTTLPQFIVVAEERMLRGRTRSKPIRSKPCSEMVGNEFALSVLGSFDLNISRCGIYNYKYLSCGGGS